jgi:integral membrane protein
VSETPVGAVIESLSPRARLTRKVRFTKAFAIVECVSYSLLLIFMFRKYILDDRGNANYLMLRVVAYFHGMICIAFGVMILDIFRAMKWSTKFALLTLAGPPGALIAHRRLRRQPLPDVVNKRDMLF